MPSLFFADLVRELAQEGGTGPLTPTGAVPGHRRFAGVVPPGVSFHYAVAGIARPDEWEVGTGRIGGDGRLLRDMVAASSAGGATVDFAPGLKTIALTVGAGWFAAQDMQSAAFGDEVAGLGSELAGLSSALDAKQPLSTTHGNAAAGEAADLVTVRRGAGWINIPLSAVAFRGADGRYVLDGALDARRAVDGDIVDIGKDGGERLRVFVNNSTIGLFNVAGAGAGRDGLRITDGAVAVDIAAAERGRFHPGGLELTMPNSGKLFAEQAGAASVKLRSSATMQYEAGAASSHQFLVNGTQVAQLSSAGSLQPATDNGPALGAAAFRWSVVYAGTGTINTSDARDKTWRDAPSDAELRAARRIVAELGFFQWNAAIGEKGADGARLHFGVRAQSVWALMADEGLIEPLAEGTTPSSRYAFLCHDAWDQTGGSGDEAAADRFGIRTDQLALFLIAAQEARLAALEAAA
ncbi:MAG: tail fiber domain-containing protein [Sphingopyxis sp.]|uniref:tail fiber domain-containing protein n=1 Tax=Sphingopyxis sp. TaxID=1908224 RepID=UPI0032EEBD86